MSAGAASRKGCQPDVRLQPHEDAEEPFALLQEPQPHERQQPPQRLAHGQEFSPVDVPATAPEDCVQMHEHVQDGFVVAVPATEPEDCEQQGLQHRCWTKSGKVKPLKQPQEEHILHTSKKISGNFRSRSILCCMFVRCVTSCRVLPRFAARAHQRYPAAGFPAAFRPSYDHP